MDGWNNDLPWIGQYVLDAQGNAVPAPGLLEWGAWLETADRRVAVTRFAWGAVSTVFLGLDHNFFGNPADDPLSYKPLLWETMVFVTHAEGNRALLRELDLERQRYTSREDAVAGHKEMVERCKAAVKDPEDRICVETVEPVESEKQ